MADGSVYREVVMDDEAVWKLADELKELLDGPNGDERATREQVEEIEERLVTEFGRRRGWERCETDLRSIYRDFLPEFTGQHWDHRCLDQPYVYRVPGHGIAIVNNIGDCDQRMSDETRSFADEYDLTVEYVTDFPSWYRPGETELVVWYLRSNAGLPRTWQKWEEWALHRSASESY
jgi:hypothetical protein